MAEESGWGSLGKKIFFLYPSGFIQNHVIAELAQEEFEVYSVKDEVKLKRVLKTYPDSIVCAVISEGLKESAWDEWIRSVAGNPETDKVVIWVLAPANDENLKRKYMEMLKGRGAYIPFKPDPGAVKQLADVLNGINAKGRRKYIRAITDKESNTTVNLPLNGTFVNGVIKDISVVGFSCAFTDDPGFAKNSLFGDIQLRLQTQLLKVEGIVFGSRMDGAEKIYVILFTQRISLDTKTRIRKYIQSNLQGKMDLELK